jgi:hypothetical protein
MTPFKQHDSPFSLILNKLKPIQPYNLWMTYPMKHSGLTPFKNRYNREDATPFKTPFSHVQQNKTHTTIQSLDDISHEIFWIKPFQKS